MMTHTLRLLLMFILTTELSVLSAGATLLPLGNEPDRSSGAVAEPATSESEETRLRKLLKDAKRDFDRFNSPGGFDSGAPPGISERELVGRRLMSRLLVKNYDRHLVELEKIEALREKRAELKMIVARGVSFKEKPPYSVLMVEGLREQAQVSQSRIIRSEKSLELVDIKIKAAGESVKRAETALRRLAEKVENSRDGSGANDWGASVAELERKVYAAQYAAQLAARRSLEEELLIARLEFSFQEKRVEAAEKAVRFSEDDLKLIRSRFEERKRRLQSELEIAIARNQSLQRSNQGMKKSRGQYGEPGEILEREQTQRELRTDLQYELSQEELENSNLKIDVLQSALDMTRFELMIWETRYLAEARQDMKSAGEIINVAPRMIAELERQVQAAAADLKLVLSRANERESQLAQPGYEAVQDELQKFIQVYQQREKLLLDRIRDNEEIRSIFVRLQDKYSDATKKAATTEKLKFWKFVLLEKAGSIWRFELFTTEDVVFVDGKEVKGKRGVTVGKIVVALFVLLVGYIASSRLTIRLVRYFVSRYGFRETTAMLARRWAMAAILLSLLLLSLNLVRIPLTAFAFLGGAIALGAGFGMQVLMKNLMSGVMLLVERPFRIGDLVDVDGVRGRVTGIGIRSSTIMDAAGIETLIPNSTFVEKNVTNWTYTSHQVRYSVSVGVAYGSSVALVKEHLLEVASRHGQLLKNPEPLVALDDFAADALLFGLYYWIDLDGDGDPRVIASDLRMMIEKSLAEAGIVIAFPQRDIHLDMVRPLKVEMVAADCRKGNAKNLTSSASAPSASAQR